VWFRIAFRTFLMNKAFVLITLFVFILGTGGLKHVSKGNKNETERILVFCCRAVIYVLSLGQWLWYHVKSICRDVRNRKLVRMYGMPCPEYLENYQDCATLFLTVILSAMLAIEPICTASRTRTMTSSAMGCSRRCAPRRIPLGTYIPT